MDLNKFLKVFGLLFVVIGAVVGILFISLSIVTRSYPMIFMGVMFPLVFCGVGGFFAWIGMSALKREEKIAEEGVALVVRYKKDGLIKQAVVRTGYTDTASIPRGATVTISLLNGEAALVPGSISDVKLPDEENLLNPDIDPEKIQTSIGASCPACGATLIVPVGMSAICPYCGRKVVAGTDGSIR